MDADIRPLKAERFLEAARARLEPLRGTYIYDPIARDLLAKTGQTDDRYALWLAGLLPWLAGECGVPGRPRVLDFGCGMGELTVRMNALGYPAFGIDLHQDHLALARTLAAENGVPGSRFVLHRGGALPFADRAFDLVTLFVVLEHLDDAMLDRLLPELARVCGGGMFVLVPNRLQTRDDHTGLAGIPWMPRWLASGYVRLHGRRRRYAISQGGGWDVHYRGFDAIRRRFESHGWRLQFVPDPLVFPPLAEARPLFRALPDTPPLRRAAYAAIRAAVRIGLGHDLPAPAWYPYLNLLARPPAPQGSPIPAGS